MAGRVRPLVLAWGAAAASVLGLLVLVKFFGLPILLTSFGGSAVILFGMPDSEMASPRCFLGGHVIATAVGLAFMTLFGDSMIVMALAMATALTLMQITRTVHSPAGGDPLILIAAHAPVAAGLWALALGLVVLFAGALAFNRLRRVA